MYQYVADVLRGKGDVMLTSGPAGPRERFNFGSLYCSTLEEKCTLLEK